MTASKKAIELIKEFEGCILKAYPDPKTGNTPFTIGYGSTMKKDGTRFQLGDEISQLEAEELLQWEVVQKSRVVASLIRQTVNQNQFDALLSFTFNLGIRKFKGSTLLKYVNINPNEYKIRDEFMKWVSKGTPVEKGLTRRRKAEADLYFSLDL